MTPPARAICLLLGILSYSVAHSTEPWTVIGAGNLTCKQWTASDSDTQTEVLSWMTGFASSVNIMRASKGEKFPLDLLTYDYLRREITLVCSSEHNSNVTMLTGIFGVLARSPFVGR